MNRDKLLELYKKYELSADDVYKHQHYVIITRQGIDKIQGVEQININYDIIKCPTYYVLNIYEMFYYNIKIYIINTYSSRCNLVVRIRLH